MIDSRNCNKEPPTPALRKMHEISKFSPPDTIGTIQKFFSPNRLGVFLSLKARPEGMTVEELVQDTGLTKRVILSSLAFLRDFGVVEDKRITNPGHGLKVLAVATRNVVINIR